MPSPRDVALPRLLDDDGPGAPGEVARERRVVRRNGEAQHAHRFDDVDAERAELVDRSRGMRPEAKTRVLMPSMTMLNAASMTPSTG